METIGKSKLWTFVPGCSKAAASLSCTKIRKSEAFSVSDYLDLAKKIAELQFLNREHVLLFRGQRRDHKNVKHNTSLKPRFFRPKSGLSATSEELRTRFDLLADAEQRLVEEFQKQRLDGRDRLKRQQVLRWSILQHYEICDTPLLDVTHSLRIRGVVCKRRC